MASVAGNESTQVGPRNYRADQGFFTGLSIALSLLILVGFGQLAARGITVPGEFPLRVHVHAFLLIAWLATFSYQNWLAYKGKLSRHRMLGRTALLIVFAIIIANAYVTIMVIMEGRLGPDFTPGSFIALGTADTLFFAGLVAWALSCTSDPQSHRRLMFGATLILAAAGINRLLGNVAGEYTEYLSIAVQLAFLAVMAWNDQRVLGHIHKTTLVLVPIVLVERALPHLLGDFPPVADFAQALVG